MYPINTPCLSALRDYGTYPKLHTSKVLVIIVRNYHPSRRKFGGGERIRNMISLHISCLLFMDVIKGIRVMNIDPPAGCVGVGGIPFDIISQMCAIIHVQM